MYILSGVAIFAVIVFPILVLALVLSNGDGDDESDDGNGESPTATTEEDADSTPSEDSTEEVAEQTPTATPQGPASTPIAAVERFIENSGQEFAGDCAETNLEEDVGKICASEAGMSGSQFAFNVGPTFSEFTDIFFVVAAGDEYVVDHIEPAPCRGALPCPPPTGATVIVVTPEGCVNARSEPTISGAVNECVSDGTRAELIGGPVQADARTWVELLNLGWISASFIECVEDCG
jgi:hypothetical protein